MKPTLLIAEGDPDDGVVGKPARTPIILQQMIEGFLVSVRRVGRHRGATELVQSVGFKRFLVD